MAFAAFSWAFPVHTYTPTAMSFTQYLITRNPAQGILAIDCSLFASKAVDFINQNTFHYPYYYANCISLHVV